MSAGHIAAHLMRNPVVRTVGKGAVGATAGMAAGSALTTVGATSVGGAITSASTAAMGAAASALVL